MSACLQLVGVLLDNSLPLEALPVIALWEHMASHVTRSLHTTVLCRIARVRALVSLGLMQQAASVLAGLLAGSHLPDTTLDSDLIIKGEDGIPLPQQAAVAFQNNVLPGDPANKDALALIADSELNPALDKLYGSWLVAHLTMARASFLMKAGGTPNQWRSLHWASVEKASLPAGGPAGRVTSAKAGAKGKAAAAPAPPPSGPVLPEVVEGMLLDKAELLLRRALVSVQGAHTSCTVPLLVS